MACFAENSKIESFAAHDLPRITFHGLRHTSATLLISDGVPMRAVSAVLGHAQASTTANIYAHVLEESLDQAAGAIEHHLAPSGTKSGTIPGKKPPIRG
jgi:integrase